VTLLGARADEAKPAAWRRLGVNRVLFALPPVGRDAVLPPLDQCAAVAAKIG
jgi:hypothetical protein